jgi:hypothetical protein
MFGVVTPTKGTQETKMKIKNLLMAAATVTALVAGTGVASAADKDWDGRGDNSWAERHDRDGYRDNKRYDHRMNRNDRRDYRRMINHDRVYSVVRAHRYRYIGAPYWYRGHYGVRAYDPYGKIVFVGVDPYSGAWGGVYFRF